MNKNTKNNEIETMANEVMVNKIVINVPKDFLHNLNFMATMWLSDLPKLAKMYKWFAENQIEEYKKFGMTDAFLCSTLIYEMVISNIPNRSQLHNEKLVQDFKHKFDFLLNENKTLKKCKNTTKKVVKDIAS